MAENVGGNLDTGEDIPLGKGELRAEIQGLRHALRVLCWINVANLAGVAAIWIIAIIVALHIMHLG